MSRTFFNSRLIRTNLSSGRSRYIRAPLTTVFLHGKNTQSFCQDTTRPPCRMTHGFFPLPLSCCSRGVAGCPRRGGSERPYERSKGKTTVLHLRSEKDGSEGETSPFVVRMFAKRDLKNVLTKCRYAGTILYRFKIRNLFYDNY